MTRVALVTCKQLPEPDVDEALLVQALRDRGVRTEVTAWDDEHVDWAAFDLAVIRSTWNYYNARARFLAWAERVAAVTRLMNPLAVLRWNTDKHYLESLAAHGIPIVPTRFIGAGDRPRFAELVRSLGSDRFVLKPAVSAGSYKTERFDGSQLTAAGQHLDEILAAGEAMLQPYVRSVETRGERAIIWIDGEITHAVRKEPRFGKAQETVSKAVAVDADEQAFAARVLAALPIRERLLYARVDVARDEVGDLQLMELEVTEPSLFLAQHQPALARFVAAIANR